MRLVWKKYDYYSPFWVMWGLECALGGGYGLLVMGFSGSLMLWLLRGIPAIFMAMGVIILVRQYQLRPKR